MKSDKDLQRGAGASGASGALETLEVLEVLETLSDKQLKKPGSEYRKN